MDNKSKCKCGHEQKEHGRYGCNQWCNCKQFQPCVEPEPQKVRCPDRITCKYGGCEQHGDEHLPNDDCGTFGLDCPTCVSVKPEPPIDTGHPYNQSDLSEQLVPITAPDGIRLDDQINSGLSGFVSASGSPSHVRVHLPTDEPDRYADHSVPPEPQPKLICFRCGEAITDGLYVHTLSNEYAHPYCQARGSRKLVEPPEPQGKGFCDGCGFINCELRSTKIKECCMRKVGEPEPQGIVLKELTLAMQQTGAKTQTHRNIQAGFNEGLKHQLIHDSIELIVREASANTQLQSKLAQQAREILSALDNELEDCNYRRNEYSPNYCLSFLSLKALKSKYTEEK
jgi:hypothetical protein